MKRIKKLLTIGLAVLLMLCMSVSIVGCAFQSMEEPAKQFGDFRYCYVSDAESNRSVSKEKAVGINILGLVEEAREKETIIIPESIDGLPVIAIGMSGIGWTHYLQGYYNKIYLPDSVLNIHDVSRSIHHRKVFLTDEYGFIDWDSRTKLLQNILLEFSDMQVFVAESLYQDYQTLSNIKNSECISIANLSYVVDNEIYFIDDYRESKGSLILEPPVPQKDGYIFEGWYLEKEYINKWDFDNDLHIYDESQKVTFLYAKWIKK